VAIELAPSGNGWGSSRGTARQAKGAPRVSVLRHVRQVCRREGELPTTVPAERRLAPGVDAQTFEPSRASGVDRWLDALMQTLRDRTLRPSRIRRVFIPKRTASPRVRSDRPRSRGPRGQMSVGWSSWKGHLRGRPPQEKDATGRAEQRARRATPRSSFCECRVHGSRGCKTWPVFRQHPHRKPFEGGGQSRERRHACPGPRRGSKPRWRSDRRGRVERTTRNRDERRGHPQVAPL